MENERSRLLERQPLLIASGLKIQPRYVECASVEIPKAVDELFISKYEALTHKQLCKYSDDVWWKNLRRGLMIAFWATMLLMILAAVLIAMMQFEHVCIEKKTPAPPIIPAVNETRTAYGLSPISFVGASVSNDPFDYLDIKEPNTSLSPLNP